MSVHIDNRNHGNVSSNRVDVVIVSVLFNARNSSKYDKIKMRIIGKIIKDLSTFELKKI